MVLKGSLPHFGVRARPSYPRPGSLRVGRVRTVADHETVPAWPSNAAAADRGPADRTAISD